MNLQLNSTSHLTTSTSVLSRLYITGPITINTPTCVIIEILNAHGIILDMNYFSDDPSNINSIDQSNIRSDIINDITNTINSNPICINEPYDNDAFRYIARFVNNTVQWPISKLLDAFKFLVHFYTDSPPPLSKDFIVGQQTCENPRSLNACILYKYCMYHNLHVTSNYTIDHMAMALRMWFELESSLHTHIKSHLDIHLSKHHLINILMYLKRIPRNFNLSDDEYEPDTEPSSTEISKVKPSSFEEKSDNTKKKITFELLEKNKKEYEATSKRLSKFSRNLDSVKPNTDSEAVVVSCLRYSIDISEAESPLYEFSKLVKEGTSYIPSDIKLKQRKFTLYPNTHSLYLDRCFNPHLPFECYSDYVLRELAKREGIIHSVDDLGRLHSRYSQMRTRDIYDALQLSILLNTFYHGIYPHSQQETLITLESISSMYFDECVSYGVKDSPMVIFKYSELKETFEQYRSFVNPSSKTNELFSDQSINKLLFLCQTPRYECEPSESHLERKKLSEVILKIRCYTHSKFSECQDFYKLYSSSSPSIQLSIRDTLESLHRLAMFMRGWDGIGPLPISLAPVHDQLKIDQRVCSEIVAFESKCESLNTSSSHSVSPPIGTRIFHLPLLKYKGKSFVSSSSSEDGFNIIERLTIVKSGSSKTVSSCIRLTSNWLSASAYYYLDLIGHKPPYDISQLSNIS